MEVLQCQAAGRINERVWKITPIGIPTHYFPWPAIMSDPNLWYKPQWSGEISNWKSYSVYRPSTPPSCKISLTWINLFNSYLQGFPPIQEKIPFPVKDRSRFLPGNILSTHALVTPFMLEDPHLHEKSILISLVYPRLLTRYGMSYCRFSKLP